MKVKSITCTSCSAPIEIRMEGSEIATCGSCGSVLDLESPELKILDQTNSKNFAPSSFLRLGLIGEVAGKKCQIVGRICYSATIKEWDFEDKQYYSEPWSFDSWLLVTSDKKYQYVYEDSEGFSLSESFTPTAPKVPSEHDTHLALVKGESPKRILEKTTATIRYFEGEFTWRPKVGDFYKAAEYKVGKTSYEVSWRFEENGTDIKEIEFYRSFPITRKALAVSFGRNDIVAKIEAKERKAKEYRYWAIGYLVLAVVLIIFSFTAGGSRGKSIASYRAAIELLSSDGTVFGPFNMKKVGRVHNISFRSNIPDNSWAWGGAELLNAEKEPLNVVENEFWRESGRDSEGRWSESDTVENKYFTLSKAGSFYLRVFGEKGTSQRGTMYLSVYEGVGLSRYYILSIFASLFLGMIFWGMSANAKPKK